MTLEIWFPISFENFQYYVTTNSAVEGELVLALCSSLFVTTINYQVKMKNSETATLGFRCYLNVLLNFR